MKIIEKDDHTELVFSGKIAGTVISGMMAKLESFRYDKDVIIDMKNVDIIDSVGIGLCMTIYNELNQKGKTLKVVNLSNDIYELFQFMNIENHFEIEKAE